MMSDEVTQQAAEQMKREDYDWMVTDRDAWEAVATKATADRNAARADLEQSRNESSKLYAECQRLTADNSRLVAQRDEAHSEWETQLEAKRVIVAQRDAAQENCRNLHKENEGLRADALAYPPQRIEFTQYVTLKADYDRQVIMIETLQEGLKRTESLLAKAQAQHIDDRLKGFLSVISQLADQAQDMIP